MLCEREKEAKYFQYTKRKLSGVSFRVELVLGRIATLGVVEVIG